LISAISNSSYDSYVSNREILLEGLTDLSSMIGLSELKESIALSVIKIFEATKRGKDVRDMTSVILYGPPGVGTTQVGLCIAKIWHGIGFLQRNHEKSFSNPSWTSKLSSIDEQYLNIAIMIGIVIISYLWAGARSIFSNFGWTGILFFVGILGFLFLGLWLYFSSPFKNFKNENQESKNEFDRSIIKVVSRDDFIGQYVGWTAQKTKKLLEENLGKVLFIDEAYSLFSGGIGDYGPEALTQINLFLSENPGKIAIIFAGYENLMKSGIFTAQPGLPRRCMWHFRCQGYSPSELADIFEIQVADKGYTLSNRSEIRQIIEKNSKLFPNYGGDTSRLLMFAENFSMERSFLSVDQSSEIRVSDVQKALEKLRTNSMSSR
jgi:DNA polymerase III delta prime subunit